MCTGVCVCVMSAGNCVEMTGRTPAAYVPNDDDDDGDTVAFFTTSAGRLRALPETVAPIFIYLFIYLCIYLFIYYEIVHKEK